LADYQSLRAWVLLGDPGAGKTTTFDMLASQSGHRPITARDFIELEAPHGGYPTPIFIDGLDEAAALEGQSPLGRIRSKLSALDTTPFRLSCREADWRGSTDSDALQRLAGEGEFAELHLTELNDEQILKFAAHWLKASEAEAQAFVDQARQRDLEGLLTNPQTLRMLVEAVGNSAEGWPRSKAEVYEKACAKLVQEQNEVRLAAQRRNTILDAQLLNAAGYLCAVMLLSGSSVIALQRQKTPATHAMVLNTLTTDSANTPSTVACNKVLETHLFSSDGKGNFTPVHRTVAEYLGAKYLADRIRSHLPANRVLALIQGQDGGVVPELRGLHAWLAVVTDESVRRTLIDHDALGLVLHGDVLRFSTREKVHVLQALQREAQRYAHFRSQNWASRPFGALATSDMEATFREWLESPDRSPAHQAVLDCVLDAMEHGQTMLGLTRDLVRVVRDETYRTEIRQSAIGVLCTTDKNNQDWTVTTGLLKQVWDKKIEDSEDVLLGVLLKHLYPNSISAQEIWGYYKPSSLKLDNNQWEFWSYLTRYTPRDTLPELLDSLVTSNIRLTSDSEEYELSEMVGNLLVETITDFGEICETAKAYNWLSLGLGKYGENGLQLDNRNVLGQWLAEHSARYKALFEFGLSNFDGPPGSARMYVQNLRNMLCNAAHPKDAPGWYLLLAESRNGEMRQALIGASFQIATQMDGDDAAFEGLSSWAQNHPIDLDWINTTILSSPYPPDEFQQSINEQSNTYKTKTNQRQQERRLFLAAELPKLSTREAHIGLLIEIGQTYLGALRNSNLKSPEERLLKLCQENTYWVNLALAGLRHCLHRTDLPGAKKILDLHVESRFLRISSACLAAMHLRFQESPSNALDIPEELLRTLIAFWLTSPDRMPPTWFAKLAEKQPELVTPILRTLIQKELSKKSAHLSGLNAFIHEDVLNAIRPHLAPSIIESLPTRLTATQLPYVRSLIKRVLPKLSKSEQISLIAKRLAISNLDVAQRVYWLTAGVQVAPALYLSDLKQYLGTNQSRVAHASDLLRGRFLEPEGSTNLSLAAATLFIELLGPRFTPAEDPEAGGVHIVTPAMETTRFVQRLINALASNPSVEAHGLLENLMRLQALKPWEERLQQAHYEQNILRRKALFRPASVTEVCNTLANREPANATDLHALVVDHLIRLADRIRNDKSDMYDQFWNGDKPKLENACRNVLLTHLETQLNPLNVSAEPEGTYAEQKRADIKASFGALHIPVEIKCDWNEELWSAIQQQLIAKYSREQGSDGYGVYIVIWFTGTSKKKVAGDGGHKPKTPLELQQRLAATVPRELQHKITVLVIDCAKP
jgi:hypothetical protein